VVEKPIGLDLESARAIDDVVSEHFAENQIYRIDHYLGKETVQNLLVLRFANSIFESQWNHHFIDHIQITIAESGGVAGGPPSTTKSAHCGTWFRTTCCSCCA